MNKILFIIFLLGVLQKPIIASKVRLLALGEEKTGSHYIDDNANLFLNAANIHKFHDYIHFEWGSKANTPLYNPANLDHNTHPKAEGGFIKSTNSFLWGLYLGHESDTTQLLRMSAWGQAMDDRLPAPDNNIDFFFGGGDRIKWAANFFYSSSEHQEDSALYAHTKDIAYAVRLGALFGQMETFANISLGGKAEDTSDDSLKFEGKSGLHLGANYHLIEKKIKIFLSWKKASWEIKESDSMREGSFSEFIAGLGATEQLTPKQTLFARFNLFQETSEVQYGAGTTQGKIIRYPIVIGYEGMATDWLTLRASVSHNISGKRDTKNLANVPHIVARTIFAHRYNGNPLDTANKKETLANSTTVSAGATLNFGNLKIDGFLGMDQNQRDGILSLDDLLSRVSMTYRF